MINLFRKIRKQLANENKFQKYFRYAFGEVALIMIGIFMALQLNNWNENKKQEAQFKVILEQLYNSITEDVIIFEKATDGLDIQIKYLDTIIKTVDSIPSPELPYYLYWFSLENQNDHHSEAIYHSKNLIYNPNNLRQNEITKQIINYTTRISTDIKSKSDPIYPKLQELGIAFPNSQWFQSDSTYYSKTDIKILHDLVRSHSFRSVLKTVQTGKSWIRATLYNRANDGRSILQLIKTYYPEVKISYQDVGIIGTSINGFDDVGAHSTPMSRTKYDDNIWEIYLPLKDGLVKFRCRDSWSQNWGGLTFPKGETEYDGSDIPVKAGNYHILLNLNDNTYEFIKQPE
ncbi:DUF6090 family protein [Lutibacter sp.]|uniref:DUF6090 family protein n=1 Tax=Lutibacter sp. TaxID=1925666 RepID=UPI002733FFCA|nr:DUF6090 family protein [Lutibacter sp.]MDP3313199.1 DUF6090 family protein [Lutibacter sp.]